jgi:hypothetical protein
MVMCVPFSVLINYLGAVNGAWYVPHTVFPFRYLNGLPLEDVILGFLLFYACIITYEHFLDKGKHRLVDRRLKYIAWPLLFILITFFALLMTRPGIFVFKYAYLWVGLIFLAIPLVSALSFFPRLFSKYAKIGAYFAVLLAMFEYTGLTLNHWVFPGDGFIGWLPYFGYRIPVEELLFFIVIGATSLISFYEFFDDGELRSKK